MSNDSGASAGSSSGAGGDSGASSGASADAGAVVSASESTSSTSSAGADNASSSSTSSNNTNTESASSSSSNQKSDSTPGQPKPEPNHYQRLGVSPQATTQEINKAYRNLARTEHPDKKPGDPNAHANFQKIVAAHEVLSNPDKRAKYDQQLAAKNNPSPMPQQQHHPAPAAPGRGKPWPKPQPNGICTMGPNGKPQIIAMTNAPPAAIGGGSWLHISAGGGGSLMIPKPVDKKPGEVHDDDWRFAFVGGPPRKANTQNRTEQSTTTPTKGQEAAFKEQLIENLQKEGYHVKNIEKADPNKASENQNQQKQQNTTSDSSKSPLMIENGSAQEKNESAEQQNQGSGKTPSFTPGGPSGGGGRGGR